MKQKSLFNKIICFLALPAMTYSIGGIETLTNITAASVANPAQQAAISAEAVFYNPAGSAFLEDGKHMYLGAYAVVTDYETTVGDGQSLEANDPQLLPSFSFVYKKRDTAYYIGTAFMGQGGLLEYDVSSPLVQRFDISVLHPGGIFGVSHKFHEKLSLSLGGRFIYSRLTAEGETIMSDEFEARIDAWGIAPEIGIHYKVNDKLDLAAKYLGETSLNYDGEVKKGEAAIVEQLFGAYATDHRKNFPAIFSAGAGYRINERQKISFGFNWIMESKKSVDEELYGNYDDTYEYAVSFEQYLNEKFDLLVGYIYTDKGKNDVELVDITELSAHQVGSGIRYKKDENTEITIGAGIIYYETEDSKLGGLDVTTRKKEYLFGVGLNKKL